MWTIESELSQNAFVDDGVEQTISGLRVSKTIKISKSDSIVLHRVLPIARVHFSCVNQ